MGVSKLRSRREERIVACGFGTVSYNDEDGFPTYDLMATSSFGAGGFVEASEGTVEVGLFGTQNCERPYNAWPGSAPNQFRMPSRTGFLTAAAIWCDAG